MLDAAHIKPYAASGPHALSNGLLLRKDLHALFDPAALAPCDVLPGPGVVEDEGPRTHDGDPRIGATACAYGWDAGDNPHFQLRTQYTSVLEAEALAARLIPETREVLVDDAGIRAWMGTVEAMGFEYVAVIAHRDPYLFVGYLRPVSEPAGGPRPPRPIDHRDRLRAVELVYGIVGNLDALNAGQSPGYVLEIAP